MTPSALAGDTIPCPAGCGAVLRVTQRGRIDGRQRHHTSCPKGWQPPPGKRQGSQRRRADARAANGGPGALAGGGRGNGGGAGGETAAGRRPMRLKASAWTVAAASALRDFGTAAHLPASNLTRVQDMNTHFLRLQSLGCGPEHSAGRAAHHRDEAELSEDDLDEDELAALRSSPDDGGPLPPLPPAPPADPRANAARAYFHASEGEPGKATRALASNGVHNISDPAVKRALLEKYPAAPPPGGTDAGAAAAGAGAAGAPWRPLPRDTVDACQPPVILTEQIASFLRSRSKSAGGMSGWTYRLLRLLGADAAKLIRPLINCIINGDVTPEMRDALATARGVALRKKDGGVRPVGITEIWVRIAAGVIISARASEIKRAVGPNQLAFHTPNGCEIAVHTARAVFREGKAGTGCCITVADAKNAFNSVLRDGEHGVLEAVREAVPALLPLAHLMYGASNKVIYSSKGDPRPLLINADRGVTQGDPLGPILYMIAVAPAYEETRAAHPDAVIVLDADDTIILSRIDAAARAIETLQQRLEPRGISFVPEKLRVLAPSDAVAASAGADALRTIAGNPDAVTTEGIELLGAPIGSPEYERAAVGAKADVICARVSALVDPQLDELDPIRLGDGVPLKMGLQSVIELCLPASFTYLLRATSPAVTADAAARINGAVVEAVARLHHIDTSTPRWETARGERRVLLPKKEGGVGIYDLVRAGPCALVGAIAQGGVHIGELVRDVRRAAGAAPAAADAAVDISGLADAYELLNGVGDETGELTDALAALPLPALIPAVAPAPDAPTVRGNARKRAQARLYGLVAAQVSREVWQELFAFDNGGDPDAPGDDAAFFLSGKQKGGAWLHVPYRGPGSTSLSDEKQCAAMALRLGQPVMRCARLCRCGTMGDVYGRHALICTLDSRSSKRHWHFDKELYNISCDAGSSGLVVRQKQAEVDRHFDRKPLPPDRQYRRRRADIVADRPNNASKQWPKLLDATLVYPNQPNAHREAGASAAAGEARKRKFYHSQFSFPSDDNILPIAAELMGYLSGCAVGWLRYVARNATRDADERSCRVRRYYERIAVTVQASNADTIRDWQVAGSSRVVAGDE